MLNYLKKRIMAFVDIFKDKNDYNEKNIVGFLSFAAMAIYAGADINFNNVLGQGKIGFSLTALIEQEISDRFAIRSGLQISHKSFENIYTKEYVNPLDENSVISSATC
jgi:hypothetical protein